MGKKYDIVLAVIIAISYETIKPTGKIEIFSFKSFIQMKSNPNMFGFNPPLAQYRYVYVILGKYVLGGCICMYPRLL